MRKNCKIPKNIRYRVRIDELCSGANLSKMALSRHIGVDVTTLRRWNRGRMMISFQNMALLQDFFGVETIDLIEFK